MSEDNGRVPDGTGLSSPTEPQEGLGPSGFDPSRLAQGLVASLTDAQRDFLLLLPPDGNWRNTSSRDLERHGPNALRGFGKTGLIEGYYQETMRHRLTRLGQDVVAIILKRARDSDGSPEGGDAAGGSVEDDSAGPKGIAK